MAEKLILIKIALSSLALIYVKPPMSGSGTWYDTTETRNQLNEKVANEFETQIHEIRKQNNMALCPNCELGSRFFNQDAQLFIV